MNTDKKALRQPAGLCIWRETRSSKICVHLCSSVVSVLCSSRNSRIQGERKRTYARNEFIGTAVKSSQTKSNQVKPGQSRSNQVNPNEIKPDQTKSNQYNAPSPLIEGCTPLSGRALTASNGFPLTPALSLGEREPRIPSFDKPGRSDPSHRLPAILPLPWGEGRREGEKTRLRDGFPES